VTAPARGVLLGFGTLVLGAGCSLFEQGKGMIFEPESAAASESAVSAGPQTIQERYPFVRFLPVKGDGFSVGNSGTWTAVVTIPAGTGKAVVERLKSLCAMDDGYEPAADAVVKHNPKLYAEEGGGGLYQADLTLKPGGPVQPAAAGATSWRPIEDLLLIKGSQEEIEEVLAALDLWYNAAPQIEIQASVFDVLDSELFERGIIQANGQPILEKTNSNTFLRALGGSFPSSSSPGFGGGTGASGLGGVFRLGFIDADFELDAYLQFLEQEGVVDINARPSVVTRNGSPALIDLTEEVPYLSPGAITLGGLVTYNILTKKIGIKLNVVPFLVGNDTLHLIINAEVSRLGREFVVGVDGSNNPITVPSTTSRTASTQVMVRSGQRVVLGGLRLQETRKSFSKIPFLGDLPILGWLFSNELLEEQNTTIYFVIEANVKPVPTIDPIGDFFDPFAQ
jgi:type II secretory pathway component GspD/PulD (secretin)